MPEFNHHFRCPKCRRKFTIWHIDIADCDIECPHCNRKYLTKWESDWSGGRRAGDKFTIIGPIEAVSDEQVKPNGEWADTSQQFAREVLYHGWCRCARPESLTPLMVNFCHCGGMIPVWPVGITEAQRQGWRDKRLGVQPPLPERFKVREEGD